MTNKKPAQGYSKFFKSAQKNKKRSRATGKNNNEANMKLLQDELNKRQVLRKAINDRVAFDQEVIKSNLKIKKSTATKRRDKKFPLISFALAGILFIGFSACLYTFVYHHEAFDYLSKVSITFFGGAQAQQEPPQQMEEPQAPPAQPEVAEKKSEQMSESQENNTTEKSKEGSASVDDIRQWSNEELSFLKDLNKRKQELDQREQNLKKLEGELQQRQVEIDARIEQLKQMREKISKVLADRVADDQEKVNRLVDFYSNMKPQNAARVIATLDEKLAIAVLAKMKKQNAAAILNYIEPKKAQDLSEKFAGFKQK